MIKTTKPLLFFLLLPLACLPQKREEWISKPREQWPQIALINGVQFKNGDRYIDPSFTYAGTGFLIDNGKDTLAATAKHILWVARNKKSKTVQINDELQQWVMTPKGNTGESVVIDRLLNEDSTEILEGKDASILERDWIVFSVKKTSPGIYPLKPRYTAVKPGEKIYILSCTYADSICRVYAGKILDKKGMDILITHDMKSPGGASGSPVIDSNGYLVGIFSSTASDSKTGKDVVVAISTEYLYQLLNKKNGLNIPKKDYGKVILETVIDRGTKQAIRQYKDMANDPGNYYIYNLRSANRNGLRETGERLIELKRIKEAVEILEFNVKMNSSLYTNYNILAKAYLLAGDRKKAIKAYRVSTVQYNDKDENEAFRELEKLVGNK